LHRPGGPFDQGRIRSMGINGTNIMRHFRFFAPFFQPAQPS
jgi:hypothetical protein